VRLAVARQLLANVEQQGRGQRGVAVDPAGGAHDQPPLVVSQQDGDPAQVQGAR